MQTKEITIAINPSKIPISLVIIALIGTVIIAYYLPQAKTIILNLSILIALYWLYKYLTFPYYQVNINTQTNEIKLNHRNQIYYTSITKAETFSWWLTIIKLTTIIDNKAKHFTIPIFIDSVPLKKYKLLRMFVLWK